MTNLTKQTALEEIPSEKERTVEIHEVFYNRLISVAYNNFINYGFENLKMHLISTLEKGRDEQDLLNTSQEFIDEREFVNKVAAENSRINKEALQ